MVIEDLPIDRAALTALCQRYRVQRLDVFGSFVRGDARAESDLDVLVTFAPGVFWGMEYLPFVIDLQTLVGRRVDGIERAMIERDQRRPIFRSQVLAHTRPLYAADAA